MSEEPTVRSDEELLNELISEAEERLEEAKRKLVELTEEYHKATIMEDADKKLLSEEEKETMRTFRNRKEARQAEVTRRQWRLDALQSYKRGQEDLKKMKH